MTRLMSSALNGPVKLIRETLKIILVISGRIGYHICISILEVLFYDEFSFLNR